MQETVKAWIRGLHLVQGGFREGSSEEVMFHLRKKDRNNHWEDKSKQEPRREGSTSQAWLREEPQHVQST